MYRESVQPLNLRPAVITVVPKGSEGGHVSGRTKASFSCTPNGPPTKSNRLDLPFGNCTVEMVGGEIRPDLTVIPPLIGYYICHMIANPITAEAQDWSLYTIQGETPDRISFKKWVESVPRRTPPNEFNLMPSGIYYYNLSLVGIFPDKYIIISRWKTCIMLLSLINNYSII